MGRFSFSKKLSLFVALLTITLFVFTPFSQAQEQEEQKPQEVTKATAIFGATIGYFSTLQENAKGRFFYGLCCAFNISDTLSIIGRWNAYSVSSEGQSISHNFFDAGLATNGFGAGVCFTSLSGLTGTGFFIEFGSNEPGTFFSIRYDSVKVLDVSVGGLSLNLGYTWGW